jgi:hypothetical protein
MTTENRRQEKGSVWTEKRDCTKENWLANLKKV